MGTDFLVSFTEWNQEFEGAWRIDSGEAAALSDLPPVPDEMKRALESAEIEVALARARSLLLLNR